MILGLSSACGSGAADGDAGPSASDADTDTTSSPETLSYRFPTERLEPGFEDLGQGEMCVFLAFTDSTRRIVGLGRHNLQGEAEPGVVRTACAAISL